MLDVLLLRENKLLSSCLDGGGHTLFLIYGKAQVKCSLQTEGGYLDQRYIYCSESRLFFLMKKVGEKREYRYNTERKRTVSFKTSTHPWHLLI